MSRPLPPPRPGRAALDLRLAPAFQAAAGLLEARRFGEACGVLASVVAAAPAVSEVRRAYAEALLGAGDLPRAETEARAAAAADRRNAMALVTLGAVMRAALRPREAEKAWRAALALDRTLALAAVRLNQLLMEEGRPREAAQATAALAATAPRDLVLLTAHADALKAQGRREEALAVYLRGVEADPASGVAEHNAASTLADLRRDDEALAATGRALAKGLDAAETWLVRAHALQGLDRHDEAQAAYREALRRDPRLAVAVCDLARLTWMRTGDRAAAEAVYDRALAAGATHPSLHVDRARLLDHAGDKPAALAALAPALRDPGDALARVAASQIATHLDPDLAAHHAEAAMAAAPGDPRMGLMLAEARLSQGRAVEAEALAAARLADTPFDQHALAVRATAWRMLGDPRLRELYDYDAFVGAYTLEAPAPWPDLPAYLADLAAALKRLHGLSAHPVGQSLRRGTQTGVNLQRSEEPAVRAFFGAIDAPVRAHMARLGKGRDPVRSRARRDYCVAGIWSVRLQPGGRHVDHVHPEGWLSSAFYVELPPAVEAGGREGWLKFGEPGLPHGSAPLPPERWVKPEPGRLVLFPSCMWHGTEPFGGDAPRLTLAFDLVPA